MALLFAASAVAGPAHAKKKRRRKAAAEKYTADAETVKFAEYFVKTDSGDLDPELVPQFMNILPETLPRRLRDPVKAKKAELRALLKISQAKKKPPIRRAGQEPLEDCEFIEGTRELVRVQQKMGFEIIPEDEEIWLMNQTRCTECELVDEFSLTIIVVPGDRKKKRPAEKYLLMHQRDPLMALLAQYRQGKNNPRGTNFFSGFVGACR